MDFWTFIERNPQLAVGLVGIFGMLAIGFCGVTSIFMLGLGIQP